jgi:hypothetical protein
MPSVSRDEYATTQTATTTRPEALSDSRGASTRPWVNWTLALLTVPAGLAIVISFFTARRRHGIVVPLCAWALLVADMALLASYTQP